MSASIFRIFIPTLPPGINQTYKVSKNGNFYKSDEAKEWEQEVRQFFELSLDEQGFLDSHDFYQVNITWSGTRHDVDAFTKIAVDTLVFELGFNDNRILKQTVTKLKASNKGILIELRSYEQTDIPREFLEATVPPTPDEVHYGAKVSGPATVYEAATYWIKEAHKAMLYELAEEIDAGEYQVGSNWWIAQVHKRALELIDADDEMRPGYTTQILQSINNEVLYHYAGYESAEEWLASESEGLKRGGYKYDLQWWASTLIPYVKVKQILGSEQKADQWFFSPKNSDGNSRHLRLRDATPDLRRVIADDENFIREQVENELTDEDFDYPKGTPQFGREAQKRTETRQIEAVKTILEAVANPKMTRKELKAELNNIRAPKPIIRMYKNGGGRWHVQSFELTDHQMDRFFKNNEFSAIIQVVDSPEKSSVDN